MKRLIVVALVLAADRGFAGESRPLTVEKHAFPRPAGRAIEGTVPRSLLLAQVGQQNKIWDPGEKTTYYLFDPLRPAEGFRKVYEGPGGQYCRFLTPLFGGVGVAMGEVDPKSKESTRRLFWFDLLSGTPGETIAPEPWDEWTAGGELRFRSKGSVHRLDPLAGSLRSYRVDFSLGVLIEEGTFLGVSRLEDLHHAVLVDVVKEKMEDLGELPGPLQGIGSFDRIFPVGPAARDGLAFVSGSFDDFALWYEPPGSRWLRVLRGVHIFKNMGGAAPWLPVAYLGDRRFAVAKTVKDEAPADGKDKEDSIPASLCSTMLVEGMTGRIVEETKPKVYSGNPDLDIPDGWWSKEATEARKKSAEETRRPGTFRWDEKEKTWRSASGKTVRPGEKEDAVLSEDDRWLAVYPRWAEKGPPARIAFRIIDATTGEETKLEISVPTREGSVDHAAWEILTSSSPAPGEIEKFRPAPRDPFSDPWR